MFDWLFSLLGRRAARRGAMHFPKRKTAARAASCGGDETDGAELPPEDGTNTLRVSTSPSSPTPTDKIDDLPNIPGVMAKNPPKDRARHGQAFDPSAFRPGASPGSPAAPGAPSPGKDGNPGHFVEEPSFFEWFFGRGERDVPLPPAAPPGPAAAPASTPPSGPRAQRVDKKRPKPWIPEADTDDEDA